MRSVHPKSIAWSAYDTRLSHPTVTRALRFDGPTHGIPKGELHVADTPLIMLTPFHGASLLLGLWDSYTATIADKESFVAGRAWRAYRRMSDAFDQFDGPVQGA